MMMFDAWSFAARQQDLANLFLCNFEEGGERADFWRDEAKNSSFAGSKAKKIKVH